MLFGWWDADELLTKFGMPVPMSDSDETGSCGDDTGFTSSVGEIDGDRPARALSDADIRALFASDVEDDSDMDSSGDERLRYVRLTTYENVQS